MTQAVIQTQASAIRDFLGGISGTLHLTFEEGTISQWLFDLARPLVDELLVCNAKHSGLVSNKSDKADALRLAQYLRAGLLKGVYHGSATDCWREIKVYFGRQVGDETECRLDELIGTGERLTMTGGETAPQLRADIERFRLSACSIHSLTPRDG